ncbi:Tetraspanin-4 [Saguinus oedipus]|uniref:Tetraspanin-4 n=1 Tax=Saguinus oedipus TaxID=9490 RepID=A0ABQ9T8R5_SAGOE|nr:Tetraspanin-4 [Saguinus oedipus]
MGSLSWAEPSVAEDRGRDCERVCVTTCDDVGRLTSWAVTACVWPNQAADSEWVSFPCRLVEVRMFQLELGPHPLSLTLAVPQLGGCGVLGVGIWLAATQGSFATLSSSFPSLSAANLLIVTGTFAMAIGFVGCLGAIKENKCLLLTFFLLLLLVFLLEATIAILFFAYTDKIDRYAQRDLKKGLHLYGTQGNVGLTNAWSIIQTDFRCCGVSNYTDWFEVYNATRVPDSCCLEFSESCGLHAPGTWWKAPCYETVKVWLQENLLAVGVFGLCTALVQILGLTFAMTMYCQVVKADTYCA